MAEALPRRMVETTPMTSSNRHHVFNLVALVVIEPEASEIRDYHGSAKPARVADTDFPGTGQAYPKHGYPRIYGPR